MLGRKTTGSVVCPSCGSLVGVNDDRCYMCGRANPSLWGFGPALRQLGGDLGFVPLVIGGAVVIYVLSLIASGGAALGGGSIFNMLGPSDRALLLFGASGAYPVFVLGSWWTFLSATWLHAGLLHILFNMLAVRNIGPLTAEMIGPARTVIIYVVSGVCGFLLSSVAGAFFPPLPFLRGASLTIGASAAIMGLIGALLHYGRKSGSSLIRAQAIQWTVYIALYGLIMPGIDNYAHAGGFIGGYAMSALFNPLTKERGDHLLIAALCLVASLLAIVASVYKGLTLGAL
jgi:membrane associated rhomboid family serine protease